MAQFEKITVRIATFAKDDLKRLKRDVGRELRRPPPSQDDLVGALVHAATLEAAAAALSDYWEVVKPWEDNDE